MPLVSVIVPTKNSSRTLKRCLESVRGQTLKDLEIIVVDNGSTDETVEIAHRYADLVVNWGPERSAQRNEGARRAKGGHLIFVDSDMVLSGEVLTECMKLIGLGDVPAIIVPESTIGEGFWAKCRALERSCYTGDDLVEAARFFSREIFTEVGGYDEHLVAGEDWDLSTRVARGAKLPRVASTIIHDEGRIKLLQHLAKKRYYGTFLTRYVAKHNTLVLRQGNTIFRPAYVRNWRRFVPHPLLASGVLGLKVLETGAVLVGAISGPSQSGRGSN